MAHDNTASSEAASVLDGLYTENVAAKIWRVAELHLEKDPHLTTFPEFVLPTGPTAGQYTARPAEFWTCGFFPSALYCVLERAVRHPGRTPRPATLSLAPGAFEAQLLALGRRWIEPLHEQARRTDTHDLGFITRALRMDWELTGNRDSLEGHIRAAESLASRWDAGVGAVRSWDRAVNRVYNIADRTSNFLVIIDSMCNLDLLFYAAQQTGRAELAAVATAHAHTVRQTLVRPDGSTWHVVDLGKTGADQENTAAGTGTGTDRKNTTAGTETGAETRADAQPSTPPLKRWTHQGYSDGSTWARGQAWAILGFAQTYSWTGEAVFLETTRRLADCFLARLAESPARSHRNVPLWDFDAPPTPDSQGQPLRDVSAGMVAALGMLLLHQELQVSGADGRDGRDTEYAGQYLQAALCIARDTLGYAVGDDEACFAVDAGQVHVGGSGGAGRAWDTILRHSTANNNEHALERYADTGLVYADYYFLEFGNTLLRMRLAGEK